MKYSTRILFCLITVALLPYFSAAQDADESLVERFLANYVTTFYNTGSNAFPSDEANVVFQTSDGYMWFGGYNGLYRYDSRRYTVWNAVSPNGFKSSNIRALYEDFQRTFWIGTNDRGLVRYKNGIFTNYGQSNGLPSNMIRDISGTTDGRIFCGTSEGLFCIDGQENITNITLDSEVHPFVVSVDCDTRNNVFLVLNTGEFYVYTDDGRTVQYPYGSRLRRVKNVSGGRIVVGGQDGGIIITRFDGVNFSQPVIRQTPHVNVSAIYEDSRGFIWITSDTGIGFLDTDERYHHVGNPNGVGFYTSIWEDYQNGYWIAASRGGVVKLSLSPFTDLNALYHFQTGSANAILKDGGNTWIATDSGLFILDEDGKPILEDFSQHITARTRGLFHDSSGNIWICTHSDFGVIRFNPGTKEYKSWLPEDGLASERTRCIAELPNGVIVIGTGSGVSFIRGGEVISANEAFGTDIHLDLPNITVLSLSIAADGTLFMGTDGNGVYTVNKYGSTRFRETDGLTGGVILRMMANPSGGVWVSSSIGLCFIDENKKVQVIEKVPPFTFLDIKQYNDDLILMTSSAIIKTDAKAILDPYLPFEHIMIDRSSGLTSTINANAWNLITEDGILYFCVDSGVQVFNFENNLSAVIPYAGITEINIDGEAYTDFSETIQLHHNANRLTIEISCLSFGLVDDAALYYILNGQDSTKQLMSKTGSFEVSYTNLRGGDYTFRIWTEDSAGNIGNMIEVNIKKKRNIHEYPFFWAGIVLLAVILITLLFIFTNRYKNARHHEKQREYRTIISQALTAIANTIDAKDSYTSGHSVRVAEYSVAIARRMDMSQEFIENLYYVALMHDVGKIGIPNAIINKPEKLTEDEYNVMKHHTNIGQDILKDITTINNLSAGAAEHHERWDGQGYCRGLYSETITLEARIISAADAYDAMSSNRSYRNGIPKEIILAEFQHCKGSQFDPEIANVVIDMIKQDYFSTVDIKQIIDINIA